MRDQSIGNTQPAIRSSIFMEVSPAEPSCTLEGLDTVEMFGMTVNSIELEDVFESVSRRIETREPGYIVTPNVDHVCIFQDSAEFRGSGSESSREALTNALPASIMRVFRVFAWS